MHPLAFQYNKSSKEIELKILQTMENRWGIHNGMPFNGGLWHVINMKNTLSYSSVGLVKI